MDDALLAYDTGRTDGVCGVPDATRAEHPRTGTDYQVGVLDGQVAVFEVDLLNAIRKAMEPGDEAR